jgi:hypothetical protein
MKFGSMYVPHQIASAAIDTAPEKVWTHVDHNLTAKRGCYSSAPHLYRDGGSLQSWSCTLRSE